MSDVLAYHIVWTTYGTWLPGDWRGWVKKRVWGVQEPDPATKTAARGRMAEEPFGSPTNNGRRGKNDRRPLSDSRMDPARGQRAGESCACDRDGRPCLGGRPGPVQGVVFAKVVGRGGADEASRGRGRPKTLVHGRRELRVHRQRRIPGERDSVRGRSITAILGRYSGARSASKGLLFTLACALRAPDSAEICLRSRVTYA